MLNLSWRGPKGSQRDGGGPVGPFGYTVLLGRTGVEGHEMSVPEQEAMLEDLAEDCFTELINDGWARDNFATWEKACDMAWERCSDELLRDFSSLGRWV